MKVNTKMPEAAARNSDRIVLKLKLFEEKESMLWAIILGINMLMALPIRAIIINRNTMPEYGFNKTNIPGFLILSFSDFEDGLSILICVILQRNSIKVSIYSNIQINK